MEILKKGRREKSRKSRRKGKKTGWRKKGGKDAEMINKR